MAIHITMDEFEQLTEDQQRTLLKADKVRFEVLEERLEKRADILESLRDIAREVHNNVSLDPEIIRGDLELERVIERLQQNDLLEAAAVVMGMLKENLQSQIEVGKDQCDPDPSAY